MEPRSVLKFDVNQVLKKNLGLIEINQFNFCHLSLNYNSNIKLLENHDGRTVILSISGRNLKYEALQAKTEGLL